jgi:hypothetical protein
MTQWWYSLKHMRVEKDAGDPNSERLGPFDTEAEAADALENARKRNEQWDADDNEWNGGDQKQEKEEGL